MPEHTARPILEALIQQAWGSVFLPQIPSFLLLSPECWDYMYILPHSKKLSDIYLVRTPNLGITVIEECDKKKKNTPIWKASQCPTAI